MPFTPLYEQYLLDWVCGGSAAHASPAGRWLSFATGSPNQSGASDGPFSPRGSISFAAANSPQGSVTINAVFSCTATAIGTAQGWNLWDAAAGGNRIAYGTLTANAGCASGDTLHFLSGGLVLVLS